MSQEVKKPDQPFEYLVRAIQEGEARQISQCMEGIDLRLLDCHKSLKEYKRLHFTLRLINNQLSRLGAEPLAVAEELRTQDLTEIITSRIDHFKSTGKL